MIQIVAESQKKNGHHESQLRKAAPLDDLHTDKSVIRILGSKCYWLYNLGERPCDFYFLNSLRYLSLVTS